MSKKKKEQKPTEFQIRSEIDSLRFQGIHLTPVQHAIDRGMVYGRKLFIENELRGLLSRAQISGWNTSHAVEQGDINGLAEDYDPVLKKEIDALMKEVGG